MIGKIRLISRRRLGKDTPLSLRGEKPRSRDFSQDDERDAA
jgi:hypothetical protein